MEIPDKIYVNFPFGEKHPWHGPMVTKQGLNRHDTTYIRKDALLERLNEYKDNPVITELQRVNIQELIEKIESL